MRSDAAMLEGEHDLQLRSVDALDDALPQQDVVEPQGVVGVVVDASTAEEEPDTAPGGGGTAREGATRRGSLVRRLP